MTPPRRTAARLIAHTPGFHERHRVSTRHRLPGSDSVLLRTAGGHGSNQPIAAFRDRLNDARLLGIIAEDATQLRDRARQDVVGDKRVGPDGPYQAFFGHDLTRVRGQEHQHLHHLGFQAHGARRSGDAVQRWLDMVGLADAEAVLQNRCSMRAL